MVDGISQGLGSHSEPTCIFGLNGSSARWDLPEKKTLVRKSFWNRAKEVVGFLFGERGVGINLSPRPMIVVRDFGISVVGLVRLCNATLVGREK